MASRSKSITKSETATPAALEAQAPPAYDDAARDARDEVEALAELVRQLGVELAAARGADPSNARHVALTCEALIMRAGIRLVGLRATCSTLAQRALVAELASASAEVRS